MKVSCLVNCPDLTVGICTITTGKDAQPCTAAIRTTTCIYMYVTNQDTLPRTRCLVIHVYGVCNRKCVWFTTVGEMQWTPPPPPPPSPSSYGTEHSCKPDILSVLGKYFPSSPHKREKRVVYEARYRVHTCMDHHPPPLRSHLACHKLGILHP